jgi:hypothetical protein
MHPIDYVAGASAVAVRVLDLAPRPIRLVDRFSAIGGSPHPLDSPAQVPPTSGNMADRVWPCRGCHLAGLPVFPKHTQT